MDTHLRIEKVHVMEWLNPGEYRTGRELFDVIDNLGPSSQRKLDVELHRIKSRAEFSHALRSIEADFRSSGKYPFLQIETHGIYLRDPCEKVADGLGANLNDRLLWEEFATDLRPLNRVTGVRLGIMAASCSGLWGIRAVQPTDPSPFLAIIGPNRKVNAGEVIDSSRAFYTKILAGGSGNEAIRAMNEVIPARHPDLPEHCPNAAEPIEPPLPTFGAINCEDLFRSVLQGYLDQCASDGFQAERVKRMVAKAHLNSWATRGRYLSAEETAKNYETFWDFLEDQPKRFEETRRNFFMLDEFPDNERRFPLTITRVGNGQAPNA